MLHSRPSAAKKKKDMQNNRMNATSQLKKGKHYLGAPLCL